VRQDARVVASYLGSVRETIERLARALGVTAEVEEIAPTNTSFILSSAHAVARYGYRPSEIGARIDRYGREIGGT